MKIFYKCKCLIREVSIDVPNRQKRTDIVDRMNVVGHCVQVDHSGRNPQCRATEMEYLKIPHDERQEYVGVPFRSN